VQPVFREAVYWQMRSADISVSPAVSSGLPTRYL